MIKSPAFQFYPADYLASQRVQMMTLEEEGAYIRLLCYCWLHGSIPDDDNQIARLISKGASTTLVTTVKAMFKQSDTEGKLLHDRLEHERTKQAEWSKKSSEGGKKSAELRKGGSRVVQPPYQPNGNITSTSTITSTSIITDNKECGGVSVPANAETKPKRQPFKPPTLEECISYGETIGMSVAQSTKFHDNKEANGWTQGKSKMKCWKAGMRYWKSSSYEVKPTSFQQSKPSTFHSEPDYFEMKEQQQRKAQSNA